MTIITRSALVLYSPDKMFDLVNDVESYPSFLPWCRSSTVVSKADDEVVASLDLAKGGIHHVFTTRNTLTHNETIKITLVNGPFEHLEGLWQFDMIGDNQGCRVTLNMDFEFSNRIISMALGPIFTQISGSLVDAFCKRAQDIYGNN
jgi:ribosome-associated toxin RatA of RatAB toxin-antitoxin module